MGHGGRQEYLPIVPGLPFRDSADPGDLDRIGQFWMEAPSESGFVVPIRGRGQSQRSARKRARRT
jgi:hypothetical protein